jgi:hypothetical protein
MRQAVNSLFAFFSSPPLQATRGEFNGDGVDSQGFFSTFFKKKFRPHDSLFFATKLPLKSGMYLTKKSALKPASYKTPNIIKESVSGITAVICYENQLAIKQLQ